MKHAFKAANLAFLSFLLTIAAADAATLSNGGATPGVVPFAAFYEDTLGGGLLIDGPASLTFTYNGSGAGFNNAFVFNGAQLFTTYFSAPGATATGTASGAGLLDFSFLSNSITPILNGAGSPNGYFMIAFELVSATEAILYLNDDFPDFNFGDMTINVKVSPVPLPAALPLFAAAIVGAGALKRRRNKRATNSVI